MRTVAVWTAFVLAYSSSPLVAGIRYANPIPGQSGNIGDIVEKHADLSEPTCEELRAMWRYTKRQSRAAKTTGYIYSDPFFYNVWRPYPEPPKPSLIARGKFPGRARNRAGGTPVYGKIVHKAPASALRNGVRNSLRPFEKARRFGIINSYPPSSRRRVTSFRTMGGGSPPVAQTAHAGSFDRLKELLRAEAARDLQEQHKAEENAGRLFPPPKPTDNFYPLNTPRKPILTPIYRIPPKFDYEFSQARYPPNVPNIGQAWTRSGPQNTQEYTLR